jgi:hypothetical protein
VRRGQRYELSRDSPREAQIRLKRKVFLGIGFLEGENKEGDYAENGFGQKYFLVFSLFIAVLSRPSID